MGRMLVTLREADGTDVPFLADLWADSLRRAEPTEQVADLERIVKDAAASPEQRLIVAEYDGERAGAVLLSIGPLSPLNLETAVFVLAPRVTPTYRRHGLGRLLMECGTSFAEENGIHHLSTAVAPGSRDANRFMARLAFAPVATLRIAPVAAVRSRVNAQRPVMQAGDRGRQLTRILAARRSMRRDGSATG